MAQVHRRTYAKATTINFELATLAGDDLKMDATFAAGDVTINKDEAGTQPDTASLPVDRGSGYSLALSAAEMTCQRAIIHIRDQTVPQVWLPRSIVIETKDHVLAQHKDASLLDSGVAQAGGVNTITLAATAPASLDRDSVILLKSGTGYPGMALIQSYDGGSKIATVQKNWRTPPAIGTEYDVYSSPPSVDLATAAIGSVTGAVGSVTGGVGGSLTGSVLGGVVGDVGGVGAGGIDAASFQAGALDAAALAADFATEIVAAIYAAVAADHNVAATMGNKINSAAAAGDPMNAVVPAGYAVDTAGYKIGTFLDALISSRSTLTAGQVRTEMDSASTQFAAIAGFVDTLETVIAAIKVKTDLMAFTGTDLAVTMTTTERAALIDAILAKTLIPANVAPNTVGGALVSRIRWTQVGTTVTIQTADGLTNLFQLSLTVDPVSGAITAVTPV